jgi:hypothetical protein
MKTKVAELTAFESGSRFSDERRHRTDNGEGRSVIAAACFLGARYRGSSTFTMK